jgi:hypothetical protein
MLSSFQSKWAGITLKFVGKRRNIGGRTDWKYPGSGVYTHILRRHNTMCKWQWV